MEAERKAGGELLMSHPFPRISKSKLLALINDTLTSEGVMMRVDTLLILRELDPETGSNWDLQVFHGKRPVSPRAEARALEALRQLRLQYPIAVDDISEV